MLAPPPSLPSNVPSNSVGHGLGFKTSQGKRWWSSWRMVGSCKVAKWNELCWQGEMVLCCDRVFPHPQWRQKKVILGEQCNGLYPLYEVWKGLQNTSCHWHEAGSGIALVFPAAGSHLTQLLSIVVIEIRQDHWRKKKNRKGLRAQLVPWPWESGRF